MAEQTTPDAYRTLALGDVIHSFSEYAGLQCSEVGEDGDVLILGHHDDAACWAAFEAIHDYGAGAGEDHDLRRVHVAWANHSEGCDVTDCTCDDDRCPPCLAAEHDACTDPDCACAGWDHDPACHCECSCDEYAWWVSNVTTNGEPATWVTYSHTKARARMDATRARLEAGRG